MRVASLSDWLKSHDLERFIEVFEGNEVDLTTLRVLTDSDLKELGIPFGPRKRILSVLGEGKALNESAARAGTATGERRQLTVLFCDMVESTKLAYKFDPERQQIILRAYEEACTTCVNRYEGYVFRMLGDGVVAFFGFPLAHESEAERAVRAGLDSRFLLASPNIYNGLGVGTTQLYDKTVVYNRKRHGRFTLGGRTFDFRVKHSFPGKLTQEFLLVDLVNNLDQLAESKEEVLARVKERAMSYDRRRLQRAAHQYGSVRAKRFFSEVLKPAAPLAAG